MSGFQCAMCTHSSYSYTYFIHNDLPVVCCEYCGHIQQWPQPTAEALVTYYAKEVQRHTRLPVMTHAEKREHVYGDTHRRTTLAIHELSLAQDIPICESHVLDVGSGEGFFSEAMKNMKRYAGIMHTIEYGDLLPMNMQYQLVTAHHVLEHTRSPLASVRAWWSCVAPGGCLVIEVPNVRDMMIRLNYAYKDWHFQEAHLHYFSVQTLLSLIQRLGGIALWELFGIQRYGQDSHDHWKTFMKPMHAPIPMRSYLSLNPWRDMLEATFACDTLVAIAHKV